jgi:hypothetical protein
MHIFIGVIYMTEFILPVILLVLSFLIKLFIERETNINKYVIALLEFPVDIMFVSASLIISYGTYWTLFYKEKVGELVVKGVESQEVVKTLEKVPESPGNIMFIIYLLLIIVVTVFWRKTEKLYSLNKTWSTLSLVFLGYLISIGSLIYAMIRLNEVIK